VGIRCHCPSLLHWLIVGLCLHVDLRLMHWLMHWLMH
jgi:hypothetical protein